ncbi:MAG: cupin domain-containing protein [Candidatus Bathyarchaeia archaeon]
MFKRNWREIKPRLEYGGNCYVRDYFRRKDSLSQEGGYKVTEYLEWVRHTTIPAGKRLPYHRANLEKILYVLQGEGTVDVGGERHEVKSGDAVYTPTETPHTIFSTVAAQPLIYLEYAIRTPPEVKEVRVKEVSGDERVDLKIRVERRTSKDAKPGHEGTCWTYPVITRDMMQYLLFATMMSVPGVLGYHRHNTEAIYYIDSGLGFVKVGGEEAEVQPGDAIYIPNGVAHRCRSSLDGQPLNVFCQGVAIPYGAEVWV